jgi:diaminopimelate epimerase
MRFTKMQGIGNDYVYLDCMKELPDDPQQLSIRLSDRHFGIGSDGLVLIMASDRADFRMRMFNPDGTEAEMCGNALRCVGKYVYDNRLTNSTKITVETLAGIKTLEMQTENGIVSNVRADMGEPVLRPQDIPVLSSKDIFVAEPVTIENRTFSVTCVSMGNPHAVAFIENVRGFPLEIYGSKMESDPLFPRRTNSDFAEVVNRKEMIMRVWERGAGETMACGTGACACVVAAVLNDLCDRTAVVQLRGGKLTIEWNEYDNHVYMTGPAAFVFKGETLFEE